MIDAMRRLAALPPSRRRQWLTFKRDLLITRFWRAHFLRACGAGSIVQKPFFWTPEFIEVGERVLIWPGSRIEGVNEYGGHRYSPRIQIRDGAVIQQNCHITAAGTLIIGEGANIMFGTLITDIDHEYNAPGLDALSQPLEIARTEIGKNCFIGAGARIQAGTILGEQCVVGANSVVRGVFPAYSVIVGAPARIIKRYDKAAGEWRKTTPDGSFVLQS